jgi:hypothetical protein
LIPSEQYHPLVKPDPAVVHPHRESLLLLLLPLLLLLQGLECANVQRKKQMLLQEGVKFNGNKVR